MCKVRFLASCSTDLISKRVHARTPHAYPIPLARLVPRVRAPGPMYARQSAPEREKPVAYALPNRHASPTRAHTGPINTSAQCLRRHSCTRGLRAEKRLATVPPNTLILAHTASQARCARPSPSAYRQHPSALPAAHRTTHTSAQRLCGQSCTRSFSRHTQDPRGRARPCTIPRTHPISCALSPALPRRLCNACWRPRCLCSGPYFISRLALPPRKTYLPL